MHRGLAGLVLVGALVGGCATTLDKARVASEAGNTDEAVSLYHVALTEPDLADIAKLELTQLHVDAAKVEAKRDESAAERHYRDALEVDPVHEGALTGYSRLMIKQSRYGEAVALIEAAEATGHCAGCGRLLAVVLLRRGDSLLAQKRWTAARADFERALKVLPDASTALTIVRTHATVGNEEPAAEALKTAAGLVRPADADALREFVALREQVAIGAVRDGKLTVADALLDLAPAGLSVADQQGLFVKVAVELRRLGAEDAALERFERALAFKQAGKTPLEEPFLQQVTSHAVQIYSARGADALKRGDAAAADRALSRALELSPDNRTLRLQRVLAVAAQAKVDAAIRAIEKVPAGTKGRNEVLAILESLRVNELLAVGNVEGARAALARAQAANADLPEVHVALAQILAHTPVEGLSRAELRDVRSNGVITYPGGVVNRYGEALSELDWARQQSAGLGAGYPYRGPATEQIMADLEKQLRAFYAPAVKFQGDPTTVVVLENGGSFTASVEVSGPDGFRQVVSVPARGSSKVSIPEPGYVRFQLDGRKASLVTEPYTQLRLDLSRI